MKRTGIGIFLFCISLFSNLICSQILDFENIKYNPGDTVSKFSLEENCDVVFYTSTDLNQKQPFYLQRVGVKAPYCFQGIRSNLDCSGTQVVENRNNNMNSNGYRPNPQYTNKQRVGCQFISAKLEGDNMPSVFVEYKKGTYSCSGDILDLDGANNAIEAYDIFFYQELADFPEDPISNQPIIIRTSGPSFGNGEIGDDGGIEHFEILSDVPFKLVEIRPNQQPESKNSVRTIFGFALDNFSACINEKKPFTPPYMKLEDASSNIIEDVHFGFDKDKLELKEINKLNDLISEWNKNQSKQIMLTAFTDPKGSTEYNIDLSKRRVYSVKEYLINNGVSEEQISIDFKGEEYDGNHSDPDWKKRSVRILLN